MKQVYYQGLAGVFYNIKNDDIVTLEHTGVRLMNTKTWKYIAPMYEMRGRGIHHRQVAVIWSDSMIRLGDL